MSFTNNKLCIYELLGGSDTFDIHPIESIISYDAGSSIILWDIVEDVKLRMHEHRNPVKLIKFFGEDFRFLLSIDSGPSCTIFISEWSSLNRLAELPLPRKRGKRYFTKNMQMGYFRQSSLMYILENLETGFRIIILTFKEFSVKKNFENF